MQQLSEVSITVATFCDSANDVDGKMSLQGAFDTIFATKFPAVHPRCSLALRLAFAGEEIRTHKVGVRFLDCDGKSFLSDVGTEVDPSKDSNKIAVSWNFIININGLYLPKQGLYFVELWLDGKLLTTLHLHTQLRTPADNRAKSRLSSLVKKILGLLR